MRKLILLLALPFFMACGDDDPTGPTFATVAGTYALQTIGGQALPVEIDEDGDVFEITDGELVLNANGSFSVAIEFEWEENGETFTDEDGTSGTYTVTGSTLSFTSTDQDSDFETGTLSGNAVTVTVFDGTAFVFRK